MTKLSYDPAKRANTLKERGLDFEDASNVLSGNHITFCDERFDYGEDRWITIGHLKRRMIVLVWTWRGHKHHIISMRKANEKEQKKYKKFMDRSG